jgi:hypothetical protein
VAPSRADISRLRGAAGSGADVGSGFRNNRFMICSGATPHVGTFDFSETLFRKNSAYQMQPTCRSRSWGIDTLQEVLRAGGAVSANTVVPAESRMWMNMLLACKWTPQ